ncbi:hypothetical protein [Vibrio fluvialis]|uniref:hypothetical protein n=1 Tax=Vibrio fluvialis TaxID=676 RepID=UPI001BB05527|nr:hypothetical protein [Vibrio fluvialis]QUF70041.1 hypothetical protein KC397_06515 [Vibrio fluvialis]
MYTTTQRMEGDLPPSKRRQAVREDIETRQAQARSVAESLNRANRIAEKQAEKQREEAKALLESRTLPAEDILFYLALSQGLTLEEYAAKRDDDFHRELEIAKRRAATKVHQQLLAKYEAEEEKLIAAYTAPAKKGKK